MPCLKKVIAVVLLQTGLCGLALLALPREEQRAGVGTESSLPDRVMRKFGTSPLPVWLSARAATGGDGTFDWSQLGGWTRTIIEQGVESSSYREQGCLAYGPTSILMAPGIQRPSSVAHLVSEAVAVLEGTVRKLEPGFYDSRPGLLLEVSVDSWIASPSDGERWETVYVFYPKGDFKIGPYSFCVIDPKLPPTPSVGDRLLLAPTQPPTDALGRIVFLYFEEVFIESANGVLHVPLHWKGDPAIAPTSSLGQLRRTLVEAAGRAGRISY